MCGIAGILRPGGYGGAREVAAAASEPTPHQGRELHAAAKAMAATLTHRGPNGSATWLSPDGCCALAHTRLSVIDLDTGDQPMGNEDGSVQVVFNGEIYNL